MKHRILLLPSAVALALALLFSGCQDHPCTEIRCGEASTACVEEAGEARCVCETGWSGPTCESCAEGYLSGGGACVPGCDIAEIECGAYGACDDGDGTVRCVCDAGYGGEGCDTCVTGWQDNDGDGICRPDCQEAALSCPAQSQCEDAGGEAICVCNPGYEMDAGACAWVAGPGDPHFERDDVWLAEGGAILEPESGGHVQGGFGRLPGAEACERTSILSQSFDMPPATGTPPLSLKWHTRRTCAGGENACYDDPHIHVVSPGGRVSHRSQDDEWQENRLCVGEEILGDGTSLSFRSVSTAYECQFGDSAAYDILVDDVAISPDADCPAIGEVFDADFTGDGWSVSGTDAEISSEHGEGGTGVRLALTGPCQASRVDGQISVPRDGTLARPALRVRYRTTGDADTYVDLGAGTDVNLVQGWVWANLPPSDPWTTGTICLPQYAKGSVMPVRIALEGPGGGCAASLDQTVRLDHLELVSDDRCPAATWVIDGTFEGSAELVGTWRTRAHADETRNGFAGVVWDESEAYTGEAALRLTVGHRCDTSSATTTVTVPPAEAGTGPALTYRYRTPVLQNGEASSTPGNGPLPRRIDWTLETVCLDRAEPGRPLRVSFRRSGGGGTCADSFPPESLWVDDVRVSNLADCAE